MTKCSFYLLCLFALITSYKGQTKAQTGVNATTTTFGGQPKMVRTQGITSGNITCELQDRKGNLWFSTSGEGVYRYDGQSFTNFTTKDGLCNNYTGTIIQDKSGNILIGTSAGICKYDGGHFSKYFESDSLTKFIITSLLEDRAGNIWFGVMNKGIYRYDGTNLYNVLYKYAHPFYGDKYEQHINDIIQDKNGNIWFGTRGFGLSRYNGKIFTTFSDYK